MLKFESGFGEYQQDRFYRDNRNPSKSLPKLGGEKEEEK
jgi:hypothetical protein